jgi:hypothetical protein
LSATRINELLLEGDPDHKDFGAATISRHRTGCLGMVKLAKGRGPAADVTPADIAKIEEEDGEITGEMVKNLAIKSFYVRLKRNPADVGMKELVSVIAALTRAGAGGKTGRSAVEEAMADLDD